MTVDKKKKKKPISARQQAIAAGYRSGLELKTAEYLRGIGVPVKFEQLTIHFVQPAKKRRYTPDFELPNGIIIETKGRFLSDDRVKHLMIKKQHPNLDIRFVFERSKSPINKGSKTTCGMWCEKHGFKYADKEIPKSWIDE